MNSTTLLLVALVALLSLGGLYFSQKPPVEEMLEHEATTEPDEINVNNAMPVPTEMGDMNTSDVTEMVVAEADENAMVFEVGGTNFAYDVTEIRVKEGDTVTINFRSDDGFHDWVVDEFDAATEKVRPGTPTSVTFVADKAGTYEYYCSVGSHRANGMVGTLIVE